MTSLRSIYAGARGVTPGPLMAIAQPQTNPSDHVLRARVLAEHDKHEEAISCFEAAIAMMTISPGAGESSFMRASTPSTPPPSSPSENEDMVKALVGKGISLGKLGRSFAAAQAFDAALDLDGDNVEALTYLGLIRVKEKCTEEGLVLYRRAIDLDPSYVLASEGMATALTDEGTRLKLLGQTDAAMSKYREASSVCTDYAPAHYNQGIVLAERGCVQEALDSYARALELYPAYAEAYNNRGVLLKGLDRLPEAIEAYRACLDINPNFELGGHNLSLALSDLGTAVKAQGRIHEAINLYQQALYYNSNSPDAMYNLGVAYVANNEPLKASICYQLTTEVNPRSAEAFNNLGVIYKDMDNLPRALSCYEAALRIRPTFPEALNNMGVVFTMMNQPEDALPYFNSALQVAPNYAEAYTNLGKLFQDAGDAEKAIEYYERCLSICPYSENAAHNRLLALNYSLRLSRDAVTAAHTAWARDICARARSVLTSSKSCLLQGFEGRHVAGGSRQLRVGYLSPDFNKHSVAYFAEALLRNRSRAHFHVTCYSAACKEDGTTRRLRSYVDSWVSVVGMSALAVAECIYADHIDILVELAGHTAGTRLDVMALCAAPVQITWIGYPNTTGLETIRYRITDEHADPLDSTQRFSEELIRLPETFLCYSPPDESQVPAVSLPPSDSLGYVTFGSFNNVAKINGKVVRLWARILLALPHSRLLLKSRAFAAKQVKEACLAAFAEFSVDRSRIDLLQVLPSTRDHLSKYARMDISLDTFPYAGTTTTCESLLMAVPVVTLRALGAEATHAQNVGVSLLTQVGCTELIANSEDEFVEIAVNLARSPERLRMLRETLRQRLLASPLCNGTRYMHHVENQYRSIWRRFCDAERAKSEQSGDMEGSGSGGAGGTQALPLSLHQSEQAQEEGGGERGLEGQEQEREEDEEVVRMDREGGEGDGDVVAKDAAKTEDGSSVAALSPTGTLCKTGVREGSVPLSPNCAGEGSGRREAERSPLRPLPSLTQRRESTVPLNGDAIEREREREMNAQLPALGCGDRAREAEDAHGGSEHQQGDGAARQRDRRMEVVDRDRNRDGDGDSESSDSDKGNESCEQKQGKELMQGEMADNKLSLSPPLSPSASRR